MPPLSGAYHVCRESVRMSIWRFADLFSTTPAEHRVTLGEGNTPLVRSRTIGPELGFKHLYFKLESSNPSGSYKDRFAAAAISHMLAENKTRCEATSSGNTGAALAAYCAAAGIDCRIAIVESAPIGKLQQMMCYGADIYRIRGFGIDPQISADGIEYIRSCAKHPSAELQISAFQFCPVGMAGVQTIAYELAEQASSGEIDGGRIDHLFVQAGGGGLTLACARGFAQLVQRREIDRGPAVHCVQPEGNDTMAGPLRDGANEGRNVNCTATISGLQVANLIDGNEVITACRAAGGTGHLVADELTYQVQRRLAEDEGIFSEPAGVVGVAGALQAMQVGAIHSEDRIVCLITGTGFKDPGAVDSMLSGRECPLNDLSELRAKLP